MPSLAGGSASVKSSASPRRKIIPDVISERESPNFGRVFDELWDRSDDQGYVDLDVAWFCDRCGVSRQTLYRVVRYIASFTIRRRNLNRPMLECVERRTGRGHCSRYRLNWKAVAPREQKTVTPTPSIENGRERRSKSERPQRSPRSKPPSDSEITDKLHLAETLPEAKARNLYAMCLRWTAWSRNWHRQWQQALAQQFTRLTEDQPLWLVRDLAWQTFHNVIADWSRRLKDWLGWIRRRRSLAEATWALHAHLRTLLRQRIEALLPSADATPSDPAEVTRIALRGLLGREPTEAEVHQRMRTG